MIEAFSKESNGYATVVDENIVFAMEVRMNKSENEKSKKAIEKYKSFLIKEGTRIFKKYFRKLKIKDLPLIIRDELYNNCVLKNINILKYNKKLGTKISMIFIRQLDNKILYNLIGDTSIMLVNNSYETKQIDNDKEALTFYLNREVIENTGEFFINDKTKIFLIFSDFSKLNDIYLNKIEHYSAVDDIILNYSVIETSKGT